MAKRWTIPFVSQANKQCRIDIYDPGYTGTVTELSTANADAPGVPAADPFYFEEDDDEDLLKVVRIKTGYINLIETVQDGLIDLYPITRKGRYVEVFYNGDIVFRGYIQQQTFENDWKSVPREVNLPVISVLGLADSFDVSLPTSIPLTNVKLGYYMKQLIDNIDYLSGYTRVVFPRVNKCPDFAGTIHPTVALTDNPEFSQAKDVTTNPYKGISFTKFLEGVCNAYGWICHDMPDCILFTKFDHADSGDSPLGYYFYNVSDLAAATNRQTLQDEYAYPLVLDNYVEPSADDGSISQIMPFRSIVLNYQGNTTKRVEANYRHMQCSSVLYTYTHNGEEEYLVFLKNVVQNYMPDIASSNLLDLNPPYEADNHIFLSNDGLCVADINGTIRLIARNMWNWAPAGSTVATLYFFQRPILVDSSVYNKLKVLIKVSVSDNIHDFGGWEILYNLTYELWCGDTLIGAQSVFYNNDNYSTTLEFSDVPNTGTLRLVIKNNGTGSVHSHYELLSFDKIELYYQEASYAKYVSASNKSTIVGNSIEGIDDIDVDVLMSCQHVDDNMIGDSQVSNKFSYYHYLLDSPQNRLQTRVRHKTGQSLPMLMSYINRIQFWRTAWRWRLIALAFHPWDDEWTLTMHRSSTIE